MYRLKMFNTLLQTSQCCISLVLPISFTPSVDMLLLCKLFLTAAFFLKINMNMLSNDIYIYHLLLGPLQFLHSFSLQLLPPTSGFVNTRQNHEKITFSFNLVSWKNNITPFHFPSHEKTTVKWTSFFSFHYIQFSHFCFPLNTTFSQSYHIAYDLILVSWHVRGTWKLAKPKTCLVIKCIPFRILHTFNGTAQNCI